MINICLIIFILFVSWLLYIERLKSG